MQIREWHIVISGFQQKSGTLNGTVKIWGDLIRLKSARPEARVELLTWYDDMANMAEQIKAIADHSESTPLVNIYGYSWGGMSATNLARELQARGVDVTHMVLCDAVYRHWYALGWWRAFVSWRSIKIPDNVGRVTQFRQKQNYPRGHEVKADNSGKTKLGPIQWLLVQHCWMDDHVQFRKACQEAAKEVG